VATNGSGGIKAGDASAGTVLWVAWWGIVESLRGACARSRTLDWLGVALLGLCTRADQWGVTSWVRASSLGDRAYRSLLNLVEGDGLDVDRLTLLWTRLVVRLFRPVQATVGGKSYSLALVDGLKVPKEGHKMPGVKSLHQESNNNSKPPYIMGHSYQAVGLLAEGPAAGDEPVCVPLASRRHEGIKRGPGERRTLLDKLVALFLPLARLLGGPVLLVGDNYYANRKVIRPLLAAGHQVLSRVRTNCVAYRPIELSRLLTGKRRRGRPREHGEKVRLWDLWADPSLQWRTSPSPAYGDVGVGVRWASLLLEWRPARRLVRFVWVEHPRGGRRVFMTTLLGLAPLDVLRYYGYRFKIEVAFKQAVHTVGAYAYRFWLKAMKPIRRGDGDQYLHRESPEYRERVWRKLRAYDVHAQLGCIAQGLLQSLAVNEGDRVWAAYPGWMRTRNEDAAPSEEVVANTLRASLLEFLATGDSGAGFEKFLSSRIESRRQERLAMAL
jgi:hypothetical protein